MSISIRICGQGFFLHDKLRKLGWLMAGDGAVSYFANISIGFTTADLAPIMMLMAALSCALCFIIRSLELLHKHGKIKFSLFSDKRQLVAIVIFLTGGGGFVFGVCGLVRYIIVLEPIFANPLLFTFWQKTDSAQQFYWAINGVIATAINTVVAIVQIKRSGQVQVEQGHG
ncbi:uncharacterized protein LOC134814271 [Bolinopsis microptera]|uniref:uncharacterized protein LOC134814271 n=1 Tax=Bolinopsis microptera TaxID=2820187 RepID=UPI00307AD9E7